LPPRFNRINGPLKQLPEEMPEVVTFLIRRETMEKDDATKQLLGGENKLRRSVFFLWTFVWIDVISPLLSRVFGSLGVQKSKVAGGKACPRDSREAAHGCVHLGRWQGRGEGEGATFQNPTRGAA